MVRAAEDVPLLLIYRRRSRPGKAMCNTPCMAKTTDSLSEPSPASYYPVIINFSDDSSEWFKQIAAAVHARPSEIRVQFCGGREILPYNLICLRNCLMDIPTSIRLVTVAMGALPAFACVAWLVGEERRIAREARLWIPDLPKTLLKNGTKGRCLELTPVLPRENESEDEAAADKVPFGVPSPGEASQKIRRASGQLRRETDFRILADMVNEWFPSWEFAGKGLCFDDLLEWGVVLPEWVVGAGRAGVRRVFPEQGNGGEGEIARPAPEAAVESPVVRRRRSGRRNA